MTHIQVQNWGGGEVLLTSLKIHASHKKHTVFDLCTYVATIQCLSYSGQEAKKFFAVYESDTPVTLNKVNIIKPAKNC